MEDTEYKDGEKVLFRAKCRLNLQGKELEEIDCLVTENQVVIEGEEPIRIPVLYITNHRIDYSTTPQTLGLVNLTIAFLDRQKKKRNLSLEMTSTDADSLYSLLEQETRKAETQWFESQPIERLWFARHLNWTLVMSWILIGILDVITGWSGLTGFYIGTFSVAWSPIIQTQGLGNWIVLLIVLAIILVVSGWVLRKKNRNLLNLLWYLIPPPIGPIIILCIKKKTKLT